MTPKSSKGPLLRDRFSPFCVRRRPSVCTTSRSKKTGGINDSPQRPFSLHTHECASEAVLRLGQDRRLDLNQHSGARFPPRITVMLRPAHATETTRARQFANLEFARGFILQTRLKTWLCLCWQCLGADSNRRPPASIHGRANHCATLANEHGEVSFNSGDLVRFGLAQQHQEAGRGT